MPALLEFLTAALPWLVGLFIFQNSDKVGKALGEIGSGALSGPVKTATDAWIKVALIAAGLGIGVWVIETKIAHKMGQEVDAPPVASIGVTPPPTFGATGGIGFAAHGVHVDQGVSATGNNPSVQYAQPRSVRQAPAVPAAPPRRRRGFEEAA